MTIAEGRTIKFETERLFRKIIPAEYIPDILDSGSPSLVDKVVDQVHNNLAMGECVSIDDIKESLAMVLLESLAHK